ncbi:molybdopterin-dependent oxidoreductase [Hydrogenophaga atypica]|uniref:Molybdopterin-dependent oxidoreductase n=1 Tax=Hydrogenophaga atypica TaxID=249409 RepID=A0ABW2QQR5_9BURK
MNTINKRRSFLGLVGAWAWACHPTLNAQTLCPKPVGRPVLVLRTSRSATAPCDLQALDQMPQKTLETQLPPSLGLRGRHRWSGVPLSHIAGLLGAGPDAEVQLIALNNYAVSVPMRDLRRYDPVLASRRDGKPLSVRDKGPLILIYPFDQHPELDAQDYLNRSIWQVHEIRVNP